MRNIGLLQILRPFFTENDFSADIIIIEMKAAVP